MKLEGYYGDEIKKKVTITSLEEQPLTITDMTSNIDDKVKYEIETLQKGKEYSLIIETRAGIKESFRGNIALKTTSQKKPDIELSIIGTLQKEVMVVPEYIYFGTIDTNKETIDPKSLTRTVLVNKVRGDRLTIKKIEKKSNWITTKVNTDKKGEKYSVIIMLDKDKLPKGKVREIITIHIKQNKRSEKANVILEGNFI